MAWMVCIPVARPETVSTAWALYRSVALVVTALSVTVSRTVLPSLKVTVPVGVWPAVPLMVAVNVTAWPAVAGLAEEDNSAKLPTCSTNWPSDSEVLAV